MTQGCLVGWSLCKLRHHNRPENKTKLAHSSPTSSVIVSRMSLAALPGELYTAIIQQLEPSLWTSVVLALSRVLPFAPIPMQLLFHSIQIGHPRQAVALYLRLCKTQNVRHKHVGTPDPCASWVKEFSVATWLADADVIINIIRLLSSLCSLKVRIGPNNFSPEHLEQLFQEPIGMLTHLSLRFKP
jgi:hypothetical protein